MTHKIVISNCFKMSGIPNKLLLNETKQKTKGFVCFERVGEGSLALNRQCHSQATT